MGPNVPEPGVKLLPLIGTCVVGWGAGAFLTAWGPLDPHNWWVWVGARILWQLGLTVVLCALVGRMAKATWKGLAVGAVFGLLLCYNAVLDLARGPIIGDVVSSGVIHTRGIRYGPTSSAQVVVRTADGVDHVLKPGAVQRWADTVAACARSGRPLESVVALRHLDVVLDSRCGDGALLRLCRAGDRSACEDCAVLGTQAGAGHGEVPKDETRARALLGAGCDAGFMNACTRLGGLLVGGGEVARDPARAVGLYRRACERGELDACGMLGNCFALGDGVDRDVARAETFYKMACEGGLDSFCGLLRELRAQAH